MLVGEDNTKYPGDSSSPLSPGVNFSINLATLVSSESAFFELKKRGVRLN